MKTILLFALLSVAFASLQAAEPVFGTPVNFKQQIDLGDSVTLAVVAKPKTNQFRWQLTQKQKRGESRIDSGYGLGPNEQFVYLWSPETRTFWFAGSQTVEKVVMVDGLKKGTGGVYNLPNYDSIPDLPENFKKAVADLLTRK